MGRKKTIDREVLLDLAEEIVTTQGAAALTIDAVARAAHITKGGVQYSFGTKQGLIDALFDRWGENYDTQVQQLTGPDPDPVRAIRAHVEVTRQTDASANAKAASLLTVLMQTPEELGNTQQWYRERIAALDISTEGGRRARLAFFATEGLFALRFFRLMDIGEAEWTEIMRDIDLLLDP